PVYPLQVFRALRPRWYQETHPRHMCKQPLEPEQYEKRLVELADHMAAIISQTQLERGESGLLADDTALEMLRDLLIEFDETIMIRNASLKRFKRFWRHGFRRKELLVETRRA
ncbi:MAG: hypothetical protein ACREAC_28955, partial [Blastocatellia bacterium]